MDVVPHIARCLDVPVYMAEMKGKPLNQELYYAKSKEDDEVEDLYNLLVMVKEKHPEIQAVASGAIFSNYQRLRVENICSRLGLMSLSYLWLREQGPLLQEMIDHGLHAEIVKVCCMGLKPVHLGKTIA